MHVDLQLSFLHIFFPLKENKFVTVMVRTLATRKFNLATRKYVCPDAKDFWDQSLITGGGGWVVALQRGKIEGPKYFLPPPPQGQSFLTPSPHSPGDKVNHF